MLRFRIRARPRKMSGVEGAGSGPEGRLKRLRKHVSALFRNERIESSYAQCEETRGYAEKLISLAVRNGDKHKYTMEMADNWLLEKDLIYKLFKVLVPRYKDLPAAATNLYRISGTYPSSGQIVGVLELKGNPWPSVLPKPLDTSLHLHNILLDAAKKDYWAQKAEQSSQSSRAASTSLATAEAPAEGSSVDSDAGSSVDANNVDSSVDAEAKSSKM